MELYHEITDQAYVLILAGNLDDKSSPEIDHLLKKALKSKKKSVLVDCRNLQYLSSAGLGVFLSNLPALKERHVNLVFFGMNPAVLKLFAFLGLDKVFTVTDNPEAEALNLTVH